jgi:hypothetical protein
MQCNALYNSLSRSLSIPDAVVTLQREETSSTASRSSETRKREIGTEPRSIPLDLEEANRILYLARCKPFVKP